MYCEYGDFEDQACRDRFIASLIDETLQGKFNTNGHRVGYWELACIREPHVEAVVD